MSDHPEDYMAMVSGEWDRRLTECIERGGDVRAVLREMWDTAERGGRALGALGEMIRPLKEQDATRRLANTGVELLEELFRVLPDDAWSCYVPEQLTRRVEAWLEMARASR